MLRRPPNYYCVDVIELYSGRWRLNRGGNLCDKGKHCIVSFLIGDNNSTPRSLTPVSRVTGKHHPQEGHAPRQSAEASVKDADVLGDGISR